MRDHEIGDSADIEYIGRVNKIGPNGPVVDEKHQPDEYVDSADSVHFAVASLHQLSALETETLAAEIHLLGQLRDRISPAARYADRIEIKYRRLNRNTNAEGQQTEYLLEGFPFADRGKPLCGLLVIDKYAAVELETGHGSAQVGQYFGERLYLTHDRKWILAERVGTYSEATGSTSEWEASCRIVTDRSLLERYSIDIITDGLFEATNKLWRKLTPRMETLKKRSEKAQQVSLALAKLGSTRFTSTMQSVPRKESTASEQDKFTEPNKLSIISAR